MPICVPIKEMKNTAAFTKMVEEAHAPITVTKNGYDAFVVMKSAEYEMMQQELSKARLLARVAQAEQEFVAGQYSDGAAFVASIRDKYGL